MGKYILIFTFSILSLLAATSGSEEALLENIQNTEQNDEQNDVYQEQNFTDSVILQGINKITARVSSLTIHINQKVNFGNLEIELLKCWRAPPEEEPESKSLLKVWEQIPGEDKRQIFFGWMFTSSPALSALEHPVYDVTVTECVHSTKQEGNILN
jgi:hypothetical protein